MSALVRLFVLLGLFVAGPAGAGDLQALAAPGRVLVGVGFQDDGQTWSIRVAFGKRGAAIAYPSYDCFGRWERIGPPGRYLEYIEEGRERCIETGEVVLRPAEGEALEYRWAERDGPVIAAAILVPAGQGQSYVDLLRLTLEKADLSFVDLPVP